MIALKTAQLALCWTLSSYACEWGDDEFVGAGAGDFDDHGALARMELWVDGVKEYTETSGVVLSTSVSPGAGSHRYGVFAVNTAGTKWEDVVYATVQ